MDDIPEGAVGLGYKRLVELFDLIVVPHFRWSYSSPKWEKREFYVREDNITFYIYPSSYRLQDDVFEHLEFALKHEGVNLHILKEVLKRLSPTKLTEFIKVKPTGKYVRILWYLYEKFNNVLLALPDLNQGTYTPLLGSKSYYTAKPKRSPRHRIADNLLGTLDFAPMVRRTPLLEGYEKKQLRREALDLTNQYDFSLLLRAMHYLYTKETLSSWEIEREQPDNAKLARFVSLLDKAGTLGPLSEKMLIEVQKNIIDPRFALNSYRNFQNYVGEEPGIDRLIIHYIAPKPEDVQGLMSNLIESFDRMEKSAVDPVVVAAIVSFAFVFIHPFEDGNGRIHRFLIHYVLSRLGFTPERFVFPVSAVIVRDIPLYDKTLEIFSRPLMKLIVDYHVNDVGEMSVSQETKDLYRFIDFTAMVEYLYECVDKTITKDFQEELTFLSEYDAIKRLCKETIDMPDQRMDLLIKCVRQNGGILSLRKRERHFAMLTDEEVKALEAIIAGHRSG